MACVGKIRRNSFGNLQVGVPFPLSMVRSQRSLNNAIDSKRSEMLNEEISR